MYRISVENIGLDEIEIILDGKRLPDNQIPIQYNRKTCNVIVRV